MPSGQLFKYSKAAPQATLSETNSCGRDWRFAAGAKDFSAAFELARRVILEIFATHDSLAVQQTIHQMGDAVLQAVPGIEEISFTLPNP